MYHSTIGAARVICHNDTRGVTKTKSLFKRELFNLDRRNTMNKLIQSAKQFMSNEEGVTAIEYGLLAALIAVAIVTVVTGIGGDLNTVFGKVRTALVPAS
jgi:pilus assembly protein Flp/PilA